MGETNGEIQQNPTVELEQTTEAVVALAPERAQTLGPEPTLAQTELVELLGPEPVHAHVQGPEPVHAHVQGPEPVEAPGSEPMQAQIPEQKAVQTSESERVHVQTSELEPVPEHTPGPERVQSLILEPEPEPVQLLILEQEPEPAQLLILEPEPEPAQSLILEAEPVQTHEPEIVQTPGPEPVQTPEPEPVSVETRPESAQEQTRTRRQELAPLNLPCRDLFADNRRTEFFSICAPLYKASMEGDWKAAKSILELEGQDYRHLVQCSITENCETALHVAASAKSDEFVRNLVLKMQRADLELQNKNGNTALCLAATSGNVDIARILVNANPDLLTIRNKENVIPLYIATLYRKPDMVEYLYNETNKREWTDQNKWWVYLKCVEADLFDIALRIFEDHKEHVQKDPGSVLRVLARKPYAFDEIKQNFIRKIVNSINCFKARRAPEISKAMQLLKNVLTSIEDRSKISIDAILRGPEILIDNMKTYPARVLFIAAEMGNTKFIVELIGRYHDLIWKINDNGQSIFHVAVSHRHESIYNLLYEIGSMKDYLIVMRDKDENTMLHLVGKPTMESRPRNVSGAAFQMQREMLWYKEVKSMIPPTYIERKNKAKETPHEVFTETHKDLVSEGEKWMKGTANKCMVVAALIATIVFGVAFTIPGGYDQGSGYPKFLHNGPFIVFVVLDAISLILSSTSILVFLSILTSRYAQEDFIESLPKKLMVGISMLFLSIVTMMIAFSVSFFVLYRDKFIIVAGFISLFALIPIISYAQLQYPLLIDVFRSTYGSRYLFKPKKQMLYNQNPTF